VSEDLKTLSAIVEQLKAEASRTSQDTAKVMAELEQLNAKISEVLSFVIDAYGKSPLVLRIKNRRLEFTDAYIELGKTTIFHTHYPTLTLRYPETIRRALTLAVGFVRRRADKMRADLERAKGLFGGSPQAPYRRADRYTPPLAGGWL